MKKLNIKRALQDHGINQATLCARTGLRTQNIKSLMYGNPTVATLEQVAKGIGCDITDLFYGEEPEGQTIVNTNVGHMHAQNYANGHQTINSSSNVADMIKSFMETLKAKDEQIERLVNKLTEK